MIAAGKKFIRHASRKDRFTVTFFSDLHLLAKSCAMKEVIRKRNEIRDDPFALWIGGGDYGEFIGFGDAKRFDPDAVSEKVSVADLARLGKVTYTEARDLFEPIKDKCLGLIVGNHEKQYMRRLQQEDLHGWLCTELGVQDLGYSCFMDLVFQQPRGLTRGQGCPKLCGPSLHDKSLPKKNFGRSNTFRVFCHHGAGAAQTKGGKINRLTRFMRNFDADIYFMGHVHDQMGTRIQVLTANEACTELNNQDKIGVISGSYLKTYADNVTSYGEQKGYDPTTMGAAWVTIHPNTREIWGRI